MVCTCTAAAAAGEDGGHLAINYWYHPPDNLDSSKAGFKRPYTSPYYPTIWAQRQLWLQQDTERWWQQQQAKNAAAQSSQAAPGGVHLVAPTLDTGSRHIQWGDEVYSPTNKYRMSMTRQGTATRDVSRTPLGNQPVNRYSVGTQCRSQPLQCSKASCCSAHQQTTGTASSNP